MRVSILIATVITAVAGVVGAPTNKATDNELDKRIYSGHEPWRGMWRIQCPPTRFGAWRGNLVNGGWCVNHCGCNGKFLKVYGECHTDRFLECYHNYCGCYEQHGFIIPKDVTSDGVQVERKHQNQA
ncbi:hypothetical protein H072_493 [Dactylellina haptotyla CBS 200.50]|uniref:Invertebrate defensins family profile domain-containing protein n=1 Tax=Dactylellina haptotyla (strain CBS 200.50) TaxID=1284197 RepID=S8CCW0_DACHA|nr:hypothetical protein H072_493 [Dactylellina haptotyla CBS 200.50]